MHDWLCTNNNYCFDYYIVNIFNYIIIVKVLFCLLEMSISEGEYVSREMLLAPQYRKTQLYPFPNIQVLLVTFTRGTFKEKKYICYFIFLLKNFKI